MSCAGGWAQQAAICSRHAIISRTLCRLVAFPTARRKVKAFCRVQGLTVTEHALRCELLRMCRVASQSTEMTRECISWYVV